MRIKPDCPCFAPLFLLMKVWLDIKNDPISQTWFPGYKKIWPNMMMHVHCFIIMNHFFHSPWLNQHFPLTQRLHVWNNSQQIDHTNQVSRHRKGKVDDETTHGFFYSKDSGECKVLYKGEIFPSPAVFALVCFMAPSFSGGVPETITFPNKLSGLESPIKNKSWRFGLVLRWYIYICYVFIYHTYAPNGTGIFTYIYHKCKPTIDRYSIHSEHLGYIGTAYSHSSRLFSFFSQLGIPHLMGKF